MGTQPPPKLVVFTSHGKDGRPKAIHFCANAEALWMRSFAIAFLTVSLARRSPPSTLCMHFGVASSAKGNQVLVGIIAGPATKHLMVDLKV
jgi:hypothetical protein